MAERARAELHASEARLTELRQQAGLVEMLAPQVEQLPADELIARMRRALAGRQP